MGEIVKNWITGKLGLDIPSEIDPYSFQIQIANGILIGEILRKYGLLSDDEFLSLDHETRHKVRIENMDKIHKWLIDAGMGVKYSLLREVANVVNGAGVKFLYELFLYLEDGPRNPEIGDKARKYLETDLKPAALHFKKSLNTISAIQSIGGHFEPQLPPFQKLDLTCGRGNSEDEGQSLLEDELGRQSRPLNIPNKKTSSNWNTYLDPSIPIGKDAVYTQGAQKESLHFAQQAFGLKLTRTDKLNLARACTRAKLEKSRVLNQKYFQRNLRQVVLPAQEFIPREPIAHLYFSFDPVQERLVREASSKSQAEEERSRVMRETKEFDEMVRRELIKTQKEQVLKKLHEAPTTPRRKVKQSPPPESSSGVYRNGQGCPEKFKRSVEALKARRAQVNQARDQIFIIAKEGLKRELDGIPYERATVLDSHILGLTCRLSVQETLLANYLHAVIQHSTSFKLHSIYLERQKDLMREFDLAKKMRITMEQETLKKDILQYRKEQPAKLYDEKDIVALEVAILDDKVTMSNQLIDNLLDLVIQTTDYRAEMGKACFGTELLRLTVETGLGVQTHVRLAGDKFKMETRPREPAQGCPIPLNHLTLRHPPRGGPTACVTQEDYDFEARHVAVILDRFLQIATGTLVPMKAFTLVIEDLILSSRRGGQGEGNESSLPPAWLQLSGPELKKVLYLLMGKRGFVNWRNFLIACMQVHLPTQTQLLQALTKFQGFDPRSTLTINKSDFDTVQFWFEPSPPCPLSLAFSALQARELIFFMFADSMGSFYYIDFLLYFCKDPGSLVLGALKALAVLTGRSISINGLTRKLVRTGTPSLLLTESELDLVLERRRDGPGGGGGDGSSIQYNDSSHFMVTEQTIKKSSIPTTHRPVPPNTALTSNNNNGQGQGSYFDSGPGVHEGQGQGQGQGLVLLESEDDEEEVEDEDGDGGQYWSEGMACLGFTDTGSVSWIPKEALVQVLWFGHMSAFPVEDPTFHSPEYVKMSGLVEEAFEELYDTPEWETFEGAYDDGSTPVVPGQMGPDFAPLPLLLGHPLISELLNRCSCYKALDLRSILQQVLPLNHVSGHDDQLIGEDE